MTIWVNRHGWPCDSDRHDARPLEVVPKALLAEFFEAADWYRRCLEDVQDRVPVRGLDEAKQAYIHADFKVRDALDQEQR